MEIHLPEELEKYVDDRVKAGRGLGVRSITISPADAPDPLS